MNDQIVGQLSNDVRQTEADFRLFLDTLPFIAFLLAPDGNAEYYNRPLIEYHGFVPGSSKADRNELLHPEDVVRLDSVRQSAAAEKKEYIAEVRLRRHDGVYRWHRIQNKPLIRSTGPAGWLGTAVDIHDVVRANETLEQRVSERTAELEALNKHLRGSETRYRLLYNRTPMALQSVNAQARLIDVNDTWLSMFEYDRTEVLGRCPAEFMTPESADRYRQDAWPGMLSSGGQLKVVDYQFLTRSGRMFEGRLAASGEFDSLGRFRRSWSAIADVTAEKRADRELRQAQRMEAIGQLTAGIAHDFNNLLTAILGNLELLAKRPSADQQRNAKLVAAAKTAAERGALLTGQLLAFSRKQRIDAEPVDLVRLIQGMEPLLRGTLGGSVTIDIRTDPAAALALADPAQLELAILNLAINARDAMPNGGAISIETENVVRGEPIQVEEPDPGKYVAIRVADTGSGIPDAVREHIFEPFFTTKEIGKGSGLGLPQVLGVVKQLGGGISIRSAPAQGTCVSIYLPHAEVEAVAPSQSSAVPMPAAGGKSGHILLVDDDADVRAIAGAMLCDAGYDVLEVSSGAAALDSLERTTVPIDVVVADVAMPGINGVEFAAIVRRTWPALPVVLMTGYAENKLLNQGAEHEILRKPFRGVDLEAKVEQALHARKDRTAQR